MSLISHLLYSYYTCCYYFALDIIYTKSKLTLPVPRDYLWLAPSPGRRSLRRLFRPARSADIPTFPLCGTAIWLSDLSGKPRDEFSLYVPRGLLIVAGFLFLNPVATRHGGVLRTNHLRGGNAHH